MKLYYTLTCIVLPAAMMAACSGSGSKKPTSNTDIAQTTSIVKQVEQLVENKPIVPLSEKIKVSASKLTEIQESDLFPLTQTTDIRNLDKPAKRIYQFGFDKQEMTQTDRVSLEEHADFLLAHPDYSLDVNGHSDTQGNKIYNQFLSSERAKKVAQFLIEYGVPESQIKTYGLGDSQPLNDVNTFKENRRVELQYNDSRVATN